MPLFGKKENPESQKLLEHYCRPDRYRTVGSLGEGGIAEVENRFDTWLGRAVAAKKLKPDCADNPILVRAFINESKLIGYLNHPGIVSVYDTFLDKNGSPCYTMKLLDGELLSDVVKHEARRSDSLSRLLEVFIRLCETLAYAHDKGVIHLDLKPDNIMVGRYGEVMVMDWGNARLYDPAPYRATMEKHVPAADVQEQFREEKGFIMGTPGYMSPEQTWVERGELDPQSDVFSAGVMLYEMLTAVNPFDDDDSNAAMEKVRTVTPRLAHEINPDVPRRLSQICERMIERSTGRRYRTFHEVLDDLQEFRTSGQAFAVREYPAGAVIFREGDPGDYAFTVVSGTVEVFKTVDGRKVKLAVLGRNEIVGEVAIFTRETRTATVAALEPTVIRIMGHEEVERELAKLHPWVERMVSALSKRFMQLNDRMARTER